MVGLYFIGVGGLFGCFLLVCLLLRYLEVELLDSLLMLFL